MDFNKKTVRSRPGLSQEEALVSLQSSPYFQTPGVRIASIKPSAGRWVAVLDIPKTAAPFPPSGDDEGGESGPPKSEGGESEESSPEGPPASDSPDDSGDSDEGAPKGDKPKADKPGSDAQVVDLLTQILHALGGGAPMGGMGGPDDLGPGADGPPAPPPHGGPAGGPGAPPKGPGAMGAGRPLKPGEVPNKPGVSPIGSPAFSSRQANPLQPGMGAPTGQPGLGGGPLSPGPNPMDPAAAAPAPGPTGQGGTGTCAGCGGPIGPDGACPTCGGSYVASLRQHIASKVAGRARTASVTCPPEIKSIKQAKALIEGAADSYGYEIKQMKRLTDGRIAALLSVR
jgi:hypothetical protein